MRNKCKHKIPLLLFFQHSLMLYQVVASLRRLAYRTKSFLLAKEDQSNKSCVLTCHQNPSTVHTRPHQQAMIQPSPYMIPIQVYHWHQRPNQQCHLPLIFEGLHHSHCYMRHNHQTRQRVSDLVDLQFISIISDVDTTVLSCSRDAYLKQQKPKYHVWCW